MPRTAKSQQGDLNGIDRERRTELLVSLRDPASVDPDSGPWSARVTWSGGFTSKSEMRSNVVEFDDPADLEAGDGAAAAHEYLLSALGSCLVTGVVIQATAQGVRLDHLEILLSGTFDNVLRRSGLSDPSTRGYRSIEVRATLQGDASQDVMRDLWDRALEGSPVAQTILRPTPVISIMDVQESGSS